MINNITVVRFVILCAFFTVTLTTLWN